MSGTTIATNLRISASLKYGFGGSVTVDGIMGYADSIGVLYSVLTAKSVNELIIPNSFDHSTQSCKMGYGILEIFEFEDGSKIRRIKRYVNVREYCSIGCNYFNGVKKGVN